MPSRAAVLELDAVLHATSIVASFSISPRTRCPALDLDSCAFPSLLRLVSSLSIEVLITTADSVVPCDASIGGRQI